MIRIDRLLLIFFLLGGALIPSAWGFSLAERLTNNEIARDPSFAIVRLGSGETVEDIAQRYLGARNQAWQIYELNGYPSAHDNGQNGHGVPVATGSLLAVPLQPVNLSGVFADGYRAIPILCYHQFSPGAKAHNQLAVAAQVFEEQLAYLARNGYQVIPLAELDAILSRKLPIPEKTVVLTIDDGYRSIYTIAYPLLKKYNVPATVFLYTDFVGGNAALSWRQLQEMRDSGLIDVQSHTRTHASLAATNNDADQSRYKARVRDEIQQAEKMLERHLGKTPRYLSYPYGDSSDYAVGLLRKSGYALAMTVERGANPSFADPYLLRRTMVYNNHTLDDFKQIVDGYVAKNLP